MTITNTGGSTGVTSLSPVVLSGIISGSPTSVVFENNSMLSGLRMTNVNTFTSSGGYWLKKDM